VRRLKERGEFFVVEVKRKEGESNESLMRRFSRKIQQSGILIRARKMRFRQPVKSRIMQRREALKRAELREAREEQKKLMKVSYQSFSGRTSHSRY
jgi:ribosomal protein S21